MAKSWTGLAREPEMFKEWRVNVFFWLLVSGNCALLPWLPTVLTAAGLQHQGLGFTMALILLANVCSVKISLIFVTATKKSSIRRMLLFFQLMSYLTLMAMAVSIVGYADDQPPAECTFHSNIFPSGDKNVTSIFPTISTTKILSTTTPSPIQPVTTPSPSQDVTTPSPIKTVTTPSTIQSVTTQSTIQSVTTVSTSSTIQSVTTSSIGDNSASTSQSIETTSSSPTSRLTTKIIPPDTNNLMKNTNNQKPSLNINKLKHTKAPNESTNIVSTIGFASTNTSSGEGYGSILPSNLRSGNSQSGIIRSRDKWDRPDSDFNNNNNFQNSNDKLPIGPSSSPNNLLGNENNGERNYQYQYESDVYSNNDERNRLYASNPKSYDDDQNDFSRSNRNERSVPQSSIEENHLWIWIPVMLVSAAILGGGIEVSVTRLWHCQRHGYHLFNR